MSWYGIDAVEGALERTKKALIQPFDFWKWIKLGIIIFLLGGSSGGGGSNFSGGSQQFYAKDISGVPIGTQIEELFNQIGQFIQQYMIYILIGVAAIVFVILILSYISNIMEFVFVESLVSNTVKFWAYSGKYLGLGFNLFIVRLVLSLAALLLFITAMLPVILPVLHSPGSVDVGFIIGGILWLITVLFVLAVIFGIIGSFITLSIPLVMYHRIGIIAAVRNIYNKFKMDWKQIIVYWIIRFILRIVAGIIVVITALILFLILFGILAIIGVLVYFALSWLGIQLLVWLVLIPYALVLFVLFIVFILLASVPAPVFIKYHMLTFLEAWYPDARMPFFDVQKSMPV